LLQHWWRLKICDTGKKMEETTRLRKRVARAGIRAGEEDEKRLAREGWAGWVTSQLQLPHTDTQEIKSTLKQSSLWIEYEAGDGYAAVKEQRPISLIDKPNKELWHLANWEKKMGYAERIRPAEELLAASLIRATLSPAQIREAVVDFWRDHFSVNRESVEDAAIALPHYDQDVLRVHALGNFREMLEAVAKSTTMLAYLNNASSKASPANENYARELLELHTLGAPAYLNNSFDRWREVPGALEGKPQGYIDQDVYEIARAFTGWTYASGQWISEAEELPQTGEFTYHDRWHDPYQKRILAIEFDSHAGPMADGKRVLDMVSAHPATAIYVCTRLCQRFVADAPSAELIKSTAQIFTENLKAKDQLAKVIQYIFLSKDFADAPDRLQRPLFLFASMQRSAGVILAPDAAHISLLDSMGQRLYGWHSPAGHPLVSAYWQSPGLLVRRWRGMQDIWTRIMAQAGDRQWPNIEAFTAEWSADLKLDGEHAKRASKLIADLHGDSDRAMSFAEPERWVAAQALTSFTASPMYQAV
jgi:uncharacterized protein (DUF1800 family)